MTTKLTLSVDRQVVQKAKRYARRQNKSLSQLVTNYLRHVTAEDREVSDIDPVVLEIADEIPLDQLPQLEEPKYRYLRDKYLRA